MTQLLDTVSIVNGYKPVAALGARMPRPRIGLLPTGHFYYWDQYPELREKGSRMFAKLREHLSKVGEIIAPELVDT